jgi:hypothetical protein
MRISSLHTKTSQPRGCVIRVAPPGRERKQERRTVSPDDPLPTDRTSPERKAALDREVRVFLGHRLRAYYDHIRQIPVSEALDNLLKQIEPKTDQERHTSP